MRFVRLWCFVACCWCVCGCGHDAQQPQSASGREEDTRRLLDSLERLRTNIDQQIQTLRTALKASSTPRPLKTVSSHVLEWQRFVHTIQLQAIVEGMNSVVITPKGPPAEVKKIFVRAGARVRKGDTLFLLDDAVVTAQMQSLQTRLHLAENILERQQKLWAQHIGTEVDLMSRQNDVDVLRSQWQVLQKTKNTSVITSPIDGTVDECNIRVGEAFTGYYANAPQVRVVNSAGLKAVVHIPDVYIDDIRQGSLVDLFFSDNHVHIRAKVSAVSRSIHPTGRFFLAEIWLPANEKLRFNQIGQATIIDYENPHALVLPLDMISREGGQAYVWVARGENGAVRLEKTYIQTGKMSQQMVEILSGLRLGDRIVNPFGHSFEPGEIVQVSAD